MKFYIVDAFTNEIFGGNPAGVVFTGGGEFPPFDIMQKTAAELGFSETAFVRDVEKDTYELRYITPTDEVDLCGHATIASFSVIGKDAGIEKNEGKVYHAITKAGKIGIDVFSDRVMMEMAKPEIIKTLDDPAIQLDIRKILGLEGEFKATLRPAIVSTGLPDILFPVNSEVELAAVNADFEAMAELSKELNVVGIHAFALSDSDAAATCRNFAPLYGIPEEAATGTSNGALTYYLYKEGILQIDVFNSIIQGVAMNRPSEIITLAENDEDGNIRIKVGGSAAILSEGELYL